MIMVWRFLYINNSTFAQCDVKTYTITVSNMCNKQCVIYNQTTILKWLCIEKLIFRTVNWSYKTFRPRESSKNVNYYISILHFGGKLRYARTVDYTDDSTAQFIFIVQGVFLIWATIGISKTTNSWRENLQCRSSQRF